MLPQADLTKLEDASGIWRAQDQVSFTATDATRPEESDRTTSLRSEEERLCTLLAS